MLLQQKDMIPSGGNVDANMVLEIHGAIHGAGAPEPGAHDPGQLALCRGRQRDTNSPPIFWRGIYRNLLSNPLPGSIPTDSSALFHSKCTSFCPGVDVCGAPLLPL